MKVWKYGDSINTDMLFPGKYCYTAGTIEEIKEHLLEDLDATFAKEVKEGDIIFAGRNFGCGSSREQPVLGLKAFGIKAVVAESFARIFYRAAINQGLVLIENPDAVKAYTGSEDVNLDIEKGELVVGDTKFTFPPLPPEIKAIAEAGGLLEYTKNKLRKSKG
jgi:3-isopropylmalate/(R)-2-methylmalate dehydratase small subunit